MAMRHLKRPKQMYHGYGAEGSTVENVISLQIDLQVQYNRNKISIDFLSLKLTT
jgi:hypothetical protein